jgi:mannosyltransferase
MVGKARVKPHRCEAGLNTRSGMVGRTYSAVACTMSVSLQEDSRRFGAGPRAAAFPVRLVPLVGLLTVGALAARLAGINAASFWSDEVFSVLFIKEPLRFLWSRGFVVETTPPLYYTLLKAWVAWAGATEIGVRSFSAVASAASVPVVFLLGLETMGVGAALLGAALFATSPLQIYYAQEARVYALLPVLYGLAVLGQIRFLRAPPRPGWGPLSLYATAAVALVYAHATSVLILAALNLGCLACMAASRAGWRPVLRLMATNLVMALLAIPELLTILAQAGRNDLSWIAPPDRVLLLNLANVVMIDPVTPQILFRLSSLLSIATAASLTGLVLWTGPGRAVTIFLLGVPAVFLAVVIPLGFWSPFLIPRLLVWMSVPVCLLAGLVLASVRPRVLAAAFGLLLAVCYGTGLHGVYAWGPSDKEDWRGVAGELAARLQPDDLVAVGPGTVVTGLTYYGGEAGRARLIDGTLVRWIPPGPPVPMAPYMPDNLPSPRQASTDDVAAAIARGRRVWLVMNVRDWDALGRLAMALHPQTVERGHARLVLMSFVAGA